MAETPFSDAQAEAYGKATRFCAYRERSRYEVGLKLTRLELPLEQHDAVLDRLSAEGFQDEARFARAYANDKQKLEGWGAVRIRKGLQERRVPEALIEAALEGLDESVFAERLEKVLRRKQETMRSGTPTERKAKLIRYGMGRGFPGPDVYRAVDALLRS